MIEALKNNFGNISKACEITGVGRTTHYRWLKEDDNYAEEYSFVEDFDLDFAETALKKQMALGNVTAMIFYLKTKGKHRGYVERQEIHQSGTLTNEIQYLNDRYKESLSKNEKKTK